MFRMKEEKRAKNSAPDHPLRDSNLIEKKNID